VRVTVKTRQLRIAARLAVVVGMVAALLAGCSSSHGGRPSGADLIPWQAAVPAALRASPVTAAPACRASRLKVVGIGFLFAPALSGGTGSVSVRNAGPGACGLTGRPAVRVVGGSRQPLQRQESLPAELAPFPKVLPPASTLRSLPGGGTATLTVDWRNWCVPGAAGATKPLTPPRALRVTLAGGLGSLDIGYDAVPSCDSPSEPSTLGVRPFQPSPLHDDAPWTSGVVTATITARDGGRAPITGRRGQVASFAVQLHNSSSTPVQFARCPLIAEMLAPAGSPEVHQLNCHAPIPPAGSLGFEMRIQIPAGAPLGNNGLFWELDPTGPQGLEVVSRLVVAK
jgi:hypothetical protein